MMLMRLQNTILRTRAAIMLLAFAALMPLHAFAQQQAAGTLQNPLRFPTVSQAIQGALMAFVYISIPVITIFIIYAGFKFVMARGNSGKITEARENFKWVILGASLILGAWVLATLIGGTVTQLLGGSSPSSYGTQYSGSTLPPITPGF